MTCPCCGQRYDFTRPLVSLDFNSISYRRKTIKLPPTLIEMASVLAARMPGAVYRDFMFERVWGSNSGVTFKNNLDVNISKLRRAIAPLGLKIETIHEVGWRLQNASALESAVASEPAPFPRDPGGAGSTFMEGKHVNMVRLD